ncbi:MAG: trehalose hydrolase, partial [bacterium]
ELPDNIPWSRNNLVGVDVTLSPVTGNEAETATGNLTDGYWAVRRLAEPAESIALDQTPFKWPSEAAVAMRLFNHRKPGLSWFRMDGWPADRFIVSPSHPVIIVASIVTSEESKTPLETARKQIEDMTIERIDALRTAHHKWWRAFWSKSFVDISDPLIEKYYYGSSYLMASCSRNTQFPPGLFGNWTTADGPAWQGDYHLNYNHEAPWWGVYSSNHPELADSYDTPILEFMPTGLANARKYLGVRGVYYNVGVGPKGYDPGVAPGGKAPEEQGDQLFLGQKSNAVFCTSNMFMRFYLTYDLDYARRVYPFLLEVTNFWEDYLKWEPASTQQKAGRYVIYGDSLGERGDGIGDTNNCLSLGLVRMLFKGILDVSAELGMDAERRAKWRHILDHLSDFPTTMIDGVRWLRNAEAGPSAQVAGPTRGGSRVSFTGLVWPSCVIGLNSDPEMLKTLQNDTRLWPENDWINHYNGFNQIFPQAVRVGHDPHDILAKLRKQLTVAGFPNLMIFGGGGGIENCSGVPATINEMLLQSHEGVMRLFLSGHGNNLHVLDGSVLPVHSSSAAN